MAAHVNDVLPTYESARTARPLSLHQFGLENSGRTWLSLKVQGRSTAASGSSFGFLQGDPISGTVELHLDKPETIKGVIISLRGSTTFVGQDENRFMNLEQVFWSSADTGSSRITGKKSWSFNFDLPAEIQVDGNSYPLPPNFSERASAAYIDYKLIVTVRRGMFRVNQTLTANFSYLPSLTAGVPSSLRQLAYEKGTQLPGPTNDPDGWKTLTTVNIRGTLFGTKDVQLECLLSIGAPLSYALGSPIPLMLTVKGGEKQTMDVLANPTSIHLCLVRSVITGSGATEPKSVAATRTDNVFRQTVARAYFWPIGDNSDTSREFQGELEVTNTLKPSFTFPNFTLQYTVELMPFVATGFVPLAATQKNEAILLSEAVTIVTKQSAGVTPRSYAPPGYEKPPDVDYNKSVGLLENGNQRFYHHHPGW